jgi:hypothetical protein
MFRKSENFKAYLETEVAEAERYIAEMKMAISESDDRTFWKTADNYAGYLQQCANKIRVTASEGALVHEIEEELLAPWVER